MSRATYRRPPRPSVERSLERVEARIRLLGLRIRHHRYQCAHVYPRTYWACVVAATLAVLAVSVVVSVTTWQPWWLVTAILLGLMLLPELWWVEDADRCYCERCQDERDGGRR